MPAARTSMPLQRVCQPGVAALHVARDGRRVPCGRSRSWSQAVHERVACAPIAHAHKPADHERTNAEGVKATVRGIRRAVDATPARKTSTVAEVAGDMARAAPDRIKACRDKALLLLGFGVRSRSSELVARDVSDLEETDNGLWVMIRRSRRARTEGPRGYDRHRPGRRPLAVQSAAARAWPDAARITAGSVFRPVRKDGKVRDQRLTAASVCDIVKAYAADAGLDASTFAAHSSIPPSIRRSTEQRRNPATASPRCCRSRWASRVRATAADARFRSGRAAA